ncbi:MAG: Crp/Fnr family transcriptional regulator [Rhizobiales bacterium]|nr:Crp/Fnr family transcriptional regulator [Hyphomicrobiales bacterium]
MTSFAIQKLANKQTQDELAIARPDFPTEIAVAETPRVDHRPLTDHQRAPHRGVEADTLGCALSCSICPAHDMTLCAGMRMIGSEADWIAGTVPVTSSNHIIPARRTICHPKEWSDFIPIICRGWAASSVTLLDGRRQILSFLLPGDLVSTACLLEPMSGRTVEAITDVTCRKFTRNDLKAYLFQRPQLLEKLSKTWVEERTQADQLALDLGRRTADERIARLILSLAERLAKRNMVSGQTMEFPLRQRHIADATGLTPVHVSKVLGEFQRAGLVEINRRSLTLINEKELRRAADWR